jgi:DNA-binding transcriptional MocR family regulator
VLDVIKERLESRTSRALANAVSRAVADGQLRVGDRLPPIRVVATELELSPTTVSAAWALLDRVGVIRTAGRRGTTIAVNRARPSRYRRALDVGTPFTIDLSTGTPDPELLPDIGPALRHLERTVATTSYLDEPTLPGLAELLHADWPFPAGRVTVVDGALDALQLIVATYVRFGEKVAVEQPCFPPLLDLLESVGAVAIPVGLDDDGPLPAELAHAIEGGARSLFIQPRAQNPTGASLTAARAAELVHTLRGSDVLIVEDDSAGAVATTAAISLGADLPGRTLHVRSYSKSHGPDLRLAAVGGAADLVDPLVDRRFLAQGWTSRLLQQLLVELLTRSDSRHVVDRARRTYASRRTAIVDALAGSGISVAGKDGLNVWIPVRDEAAAALHLAAHGIGVAAGSPFSLEKDSAGHIRVTTGLIRTDAPRIAELLGEAARRGPSDGPR